MSDKNINKMDFKELRNEVQLLRDDIAKWKRLYEDMLYNLDTDNFSSRLVKEKNGMATAIEITAEGLKTKVSQEQLATSLLDYSTITQTATQIELAVVSVNNLTDTKLTNYSTITQTATDISTAINTERTYVTNLLGTDYYTQEQVDNLISVNTDGIILEVSSTYQTKDDADDDYSYLSGRITTTNNKVSAIVSGDYTDDMLSGYLTGIEISPNQIKMIDDSVYSIYNSSGLKFYDSADQKEGWSIEPSSSYGGVFNYYVNDGNCYRFGCGMSGSNYSSTDMVVKALNGLRGKFIVDVSNSGNREIRFVGVDENGDTKNIYVNDQRLATQDWVLANTESGGGSNVAVFG